MDGLDILGAVAEIGVNLIIGSSSSGSSHRHHHHHNSPLETLSDIGTGVALIGAGTIYAVSSAAEATGKMMKGTGRGNYSNGSGSRSQHMESGSSRVMVETDAYDVIDKGSMQLIFHIVTGTLNAKIVSDNKSSVLVPPCKAYCGGRPSGVLTPLQVAALVRDLEAIKLLGKYGGVELSDFKDNVTDGADGRSSKYACADGASSEYIYYYYAQMKKTQTAMDMERVPVRDARICARSHVNAVDLAGDFAKSIHPSLTAPSAKREVIKSEASADSKDEGKVKVKKHKKKKTECAESDEEAGETHKTNGKHSKSATTPVYEEMKNSLFDPFADMPVTSAVAPSFKPSPASGSSFDPWSSVASAPSSTPSTFDPWAAVTTPTPSSQPTFVQLPPTYAGPAFYPPTVTAGAANATYDPWGSVPPPRSHTSAAGTGAKGMQLGNTNSRPVDPFASIYNNKTWNDTPPKPMYNNGGAYYAPPCYGYPPVQPSHGVAYPQYAPRSAPVNQVKISSASFDPLA
jgi:hypothetical protein